MAYTLQDLIRDFPRADQAQWRRMAGELAAAPVEDLHLQPLQHAPRQPEQSPRPTADAPLQVLQVLPQAEALGWAQQALEQGADALWLHQDLLRALSDVNSPDRLHLWEGAETLQAATPFAGRSLPLAALLNGERSWKQLPQDWAAVPEEVCTWLPGHVLHEAGAYASEELAGLLAAAQWLAQCRPGLPRGFTLGAGGDFLLVAAKFRALPRLLVRLADALPETAEAATRVAGKTSRYWKSTWDVENNLVRDTLGLAAAQLGGADTLLVEPYSLQPANWEESLRLARNLPLLFRHEAHLDAVQAPLAGSYVLEALTQQLTERAWARYQELAAAGGVAVYAASNEWAETVRQQHNQRLAAYQAGERHLVGVTRYQPANPPDSPVGDLAGAPGNLPFPARRLAEELETPPPAPTP